MQFSVSEHVTSAAVALNRVLSMWESSHQADMQIIISLKEEKDKMFRGNRSRLGTSFSEQALVLGLSPGLLVLWDCVCVRATYPAMCFHSVCMHPRVSLCVSDLWLVPSLRCLISDRLDWSAQGERDIQLVLSCHTLTRKKSVERQWWYSPLLKGVN